MSQIRIPIGEIRAVAKALDGEHDTVEDAAEAAIRALDEVRDKAGMWGSFLYTGTTVGGVPVIVGRGPWQSKSVAHKDAAALAAAGPVRADWYRVTRLRRDQDGYAKG